jgi:hypothetical protein
LEEHVDFILRVEEKAKQETSVKAGGNNKLHGVISQKIEFFVTADVKTSDPRYVSYIR